MVFDPLVWSDLFSNCRSHSCVTQVSERTISTSAALIGEGRQMLQEGGGGATSPQRPRQPRSDESGTAHQLHTPTPGLVRRKADADGVQMASFKTPAPVPRFPKDE